MSLLCPAPVCQVPVQDWNITQGKGRAAWMVWSIPYSEGSQNHALEDYMNPDPSNLYVSVAK